MTGIGLGANRPQDAVYPTSTKSPDGLIGREYNGSENYVITFATDQLPPVNGFGSITMYDIT